jgi:hypothetical protein
MGKVLASLELKNDSKGARDFLAMAKNYYKDSVYFSSEKNDEIRAFEAVVISWAYIDAGIKMGFFSVDDSLKPYFTA